MDNLDHILIFKTNIKSEFDKIRLKPVLDSQKYIEEWSVDLLDEDSVLRIVSGQLKHHQIITLINNQGFECCILE